MSTTPPPPEPYDAPVTRSGAPAGSTPPPPTAPAAPAYAPPARTSTKGPKTLGLIAFIASLIAVVGGSILAYIAGLQSGTVAQYADSSGQIDPETLPPGAEQSAVLFGVLTVAAFAVYGVFGLWGFIQGIVAAVKNRGRGWAIAAIVLAVLGGVVVSVALGLGAAAGLAAMS